MNGHVRGALARMSCLLIGFLSLAACAREGSPEPGALHSDLKAAAGRGVGCMPADSRDGVSDGSDEDCDGSVDEDAAAATTSERCPPGSNVIEGTPGDDTLHGTPGCDCILGYGGNDSVYAGAGDDLIFGGAGNDRIHTGWGNALVRAGDGDDVVDTRGSFMSLVYGEAGNDTLIAGPGIDTLWGGEGNDRLSGGGGPDVLNGGGCHDWLVGGSFIDLANGGGDYDACDAELSSDCERSRRSRVRCDDDDDCEADERCAVHVSFCVPASARECGRTDCVPTSSSDSSCDGVDDDCDGALDDDYVPEATSCGEGSCSATGELSCIDGELVDSCSPPSPAPSTDAECNGIDDDCDGATDEGFVSEVTRCGDGVCASTGASSCSDGVLADSCEPGEPSASTDTICNTIDDDCDGVVDEDFASEPTSCGSGQCASTGATACESGYVVDSCEISCEGDCSDGRDDDEDGAVDCADTDCADDPASPQCSRGAVGASCESASDCASGLLCSLDFPGGYCYSMCAGGCPSGTFCWEGVACLLPCVGPSADACQRPGHVCEPLSSVGSDQPFCRPTCASGSCPSGTTCEPDNQCL